MRIAVLAASGRTGRQLAGQALERGHDVVALVRDPDRLRLPRSANLDVVAADVRRPGTAPTLAGLAARCRNLRDAWRPCSSTRTCRTTAPNTPSSSA
jgi:uncharacterized protein YbjT (DUF2867 family)